MKNLILQRNEVNMSTLTALKTTPAQAPSVKNRAKLYTLEATLVSGPVSDAFAEENPEVTRTIQIRGDQTLEDLHDAIFTAFDREDDTMYEFRFGNDSNDPEERSFVLPSELNGKISQRKNIAGDVTKTRIDSLNLSFNETFTYWFDFSDDWIHHITVRAIDDTMPPGKYPRIIARTGESPAQYQEWEEEEEEYLEEEQWNLVY
jgi:hypothetical protein